jgi:hypothetical protein
MAGNVHPTKAIVATTVKNNILPSAAGKASWTGESLCGLFGEIATAAIIGSGRDLRGKPRDLERIDAAHPLEPKLQSSAVRLPASHPRPVE